VRDCDGLRGYECEGFCVVRDNIRNGNGHMMNEKVEVQKKAAKEAKSTIHALLEEQRPSKQRHKLTRCDRTRAWHQNVASIAK
jgi:hypothetical protein